MRSAGKPGATTRGHCQVQQPVVILEHGRGQVGAGAPQRRCDLVRSGGEGIDTERSLERVAVRQMLRRTHISVRFQQGAQQCFDVPHQSVMVDAEPVPLQHREFGIVVAAALALAEHARDLVHVGRA